MKRIFIITIVIFVFGQNIHSQKKNLYSFGFSNSTFMFLQSKGFALDYNRLINEKFYHGFLFLYNYEYSYWHYNNDLPLNIYINKERFFDPSLLSNETQVGIINLKSKTRYFEDKFFAYHFGYNVKKENWSFRTSLGLGFSVFSIGGISKEGPAILDPENQDARLVNAFEYFYYRELLLYGYLDVNLMYSLTETLLIGAKLSFDYDLINTGGFPLKNSIFLGINF